VNIPENRLKIEVYQIKGNCPVYRLGDSIVIAGPRIVLEETDAICVHALSSLLHYTVALSQGVDPRTLGLSKNKEYTDIQCLDPGKPFSEGGTVIFRCYRE